MASYLSKSTVAKYPIFGPITTSLKSIYVERDSREGKDTVKINYLFFLGIRIN
jgi:hypothetical protein